MEGLEHDLGIDGVFEICETVGGFILFCFGMKC